MIYYEFCVTDLGDALSKSGDNPDLYRNFKDDFKNNFWEYIAADKERLSDSEFERKYRYFEWFENKKL